MSVRNCEIVVRIIQFVIECFSLQGLTLHTDRIIRGEGEKSRNTKYIRNEKLFSGPVLVSGRL